MASSSSFVNLLASQGSVDLDSAETPLFSTQSPQESSVKERRKWFVKEDLILIGAWLNTSKDSIVGNETKGAKRLTIESRVVCVTGFFVVVVALYFELSFIKSVCVALVVV